MKIPLAFLVFFAAFSFFRSLDAVGTPDWDEILADSLGFGGMNSPERETTESGSADNPIQQPSMARTIVVRLGKARKVGKTSGCMVSWVW